MTMIVPRLVPLPLLGLKSRWHRHFSLRPRCFLWGTESVDSWTLGPKPLCHRHPTGPHPSGLLWTPRGKDGPTKSWAFFPMRASDLTHPGDSSKSCQTLAPQGAPRYGGPPVERDGAADNEQLAGWGDGWVYC